MMLVRASSTARVTERQSEAEKPSTSVKRSSAPRTTLSSLGSLCNCSFKSKPSRNAGRPFPTGCREGFVFMYDWVRQNQGRSIILNGKKGKSGGGAKRESRLGIFATLKRTAPDCKIPCTLETTKSTRPRN